MKNIVNYFVPEKYRDDNELNRKSRFIIWFVYIGVAITIPLCTYVYTVRPDDYGNVIAGFLFPTTMLGGLWFFKRSGSFILITHIVCGFFIFICAGAPSMSGGILSPDMPTFYIVPIFALIMGNTRVALFYTSLMLLIFLGYYVAYSYNVDLYRTQLETSPPEYFLMNIIANAIVILFLVFRNEILRLKLLAEVRETNMIIAEKSKEITDSINYAKRIQSAILPQRNTMNELFPKAFFLYLPKDIVSGDFYWMLEKEGSIFLAVGDCTGHGVPGAFMSVVGVNQLNNIVRERGILDPSQILYELNNGVVESLQQQHTETKDGMDVALLRLFPGRKKLDYAGANRPLYQMRNASLIEYKATKSPIGGFNSGMEKKFASTTIDLESGDMIYVSTDGYADQFGSDRDKKITTKKFKKMLVAISDKTPVEQEKFLHQFHIDWKKGLDQTDDVLVVGVRF